MLTIAPVPPAHGRLTALVVTHASDAREPLPRAQRHLGIGVAEALINAMEAKDSYLRGHSQRVADVAVAMAEAMGLDAETVEDIHLAGRLHDVGKIGIRESVLHKPDVLTLEEIRHVRDHVRIGLAILSPLPGLGPVLQYVQDHHERYDGCGYPRGIAGEAISLGGRILAAADAFDALTSLRPYRSPLSKEASLSRLAGDAGRALDSRVVAALRQVVMDDASKRLSFGPTYDTCVSIV